MKKTLMMLVGAFALVACGYDWDYRVQYVRIPKGSYFNSGATVGSGTKVTMSVALNADATIDVFGTPTRKVGCMIFNVTGPDEFKPFSDAGFRMANCGDFGTFLTHRRRKTYYSPAIDNVLVRGFDILSARTADDSMLLSDHRILACRLRPRTLP